MDDAALGIYRQAVIDAVRYLDVTYGVTISRPVIVRVYGTTEQFVGALRKYFPSDDSARSTAQWSSGWAGDHEVLLNHSRVREPFRQYFATAHEATHEWQVELAGFDRTYSDRAWTSCWMAEGVGDYVGWKVGDPRITSYAKARQFALDAIRKAPRVSLREASGACSRFRPLQTRVGMAAAYGMSMLAVDALVERTGSAAVVTYFRSLASGPADQAFQAAFHESMDQFLTDFDTRLAQDLAR